MRDLKAIANDIINQDNRFTAQPILFLLQVKKYHYSSNCDYFNEEVYQLKDDDECQVFNSLEDARNAFKDWWPERNFTSKSFRRLYRQEYWETENVFFTENGYKEHLKMNAHNLGEHRTFVIHAWRNPEIKLVQELILKAAQKENLSSTSNKGSL